MSVNKPRPDVHPRHPAWPQQKRLAILQAKALLADSPDTPTALARFEAAWGTRSRWRACFEDAQDPRRSRPRNRRRPLLPKETP